MKVDDSSSAKLATWVVIDKAIVKIIDGFDIKLNPLIFVKFINGTQINQAINIPGYSGSVVFGGKPVSYRYIYSSTRTIDG